ncbi:heme A synthase [Aureimonas fodinaquatilis]|uniref:Heme A synthase n=1 Tax=Aureimonas fodinaquatilis TaxID=2565783 RepID=A0A5B0DUH0_9HYPH|nr:COX15/CtaA family protein [Aureimonas fodinaquatilis]KAA0970106.1 heme A synthase [Aureimonas fodinaquatilis]
MNSSQLGHAAATGLPASQTLANRTAIRYWLYVVALMVFALVVVGGATRLTDSGLSITQWKPIHGVIPPLSAQEWQEEFDLYRQIPQYQLINKGMSLDEFKNIFWWEWAHRFLARGVGIVFALPLVFFWVTARIEARLKPRLVGLLALGGLQGFIGWWMVASGLSERTDVSQYRLAVHLTLACLIFAATMWVAEGLKPAIKDAKASLLNRRLGVVLIFLCLFQIYLGGLVAGLNAGLAFNTWPLMDGAIVPSGLWVIEPLWRNLFENVMAVQFNHRIGAYLLFAAAAAHMVLCFREAPASKYALLSFYLFAAILIQAGMGIATLLLHVPMGWALKHQAFAIVVLTLAIVHAQGMRRSG